MSRESRVEGRKQAGACDCLERKKVLHVYPEVRATGRAIIDYCIVEAWREYLCKVYCPECGTVSLTPLKFVGYLPPGPR